VSEERVKKVALLSHERMEREGRASQERDKRVALLRHEQVDSESTASQESRFLESRPSGARVKSESRESLLQVRS